MMLTTQVTEAFAAVKRRPLTVGPVAGLGALLVASMTGQLDGHHMDAIGGGDFVFSHLFFLTLAAMGKSVIDGWVQTRFGKSCGEQCHCSSCNEHRSEWAMPMESDRSQ